ncbi:MAG: 5-methyltetrahydropteroyltriglutamate--homocysteine methyltransferase, partial [Alphaproteobacteria bacterium]
SIEDAHCCNDLSLLDKFSKKTIIFGSIAVARSKLETVEEIAERLKAALNHIDRDRLVVAPDCGLGLLPPAIAAKKLHLMVAATKLI